MLFFFLGNFWEYPNMSIITEDWLLGSGFPFFPSPPSLSLLFLLPPRGSVCHSSIPGANGGQGFPLQS